MGMMGQFVVVEHPTDETGIASPLIEAGGTDHGHGH
jgi:hypothetical protein